MKEEVIGEQLGGMALDLGKGTMGIAKAMTRSDPAQAAVLDPTQTRAWRDAQAQIRAGQGDDPTRSGSLWQFINKSGPTPNQTRQTMIDNQASRQQAVDAASRQQFPGKPTPTEQRVLAEANRYNPRAYAK